MPTGNTNSSRVLALHLLVFVSGALGLAYEVLWMRRFAGVFGSAALASAATLSAFFLGTAAGSLVLGSRAQSWPRPLRAFGFLELGVGAGALLVAPILQLYSRGYPGLYSALAGSPFAMAAAKLSLAALAVGIPTFFMGGTLPVLGEAVSPLGRRLGATVAGLYAANVSGAALGALAVPFALLPSLGVERAERCVVAGSLAVGCAAIAVGASVHRSDGKPREPASRRAGRGPISPAALLALAAWSGLCTLGLEALWTRMLALVHESSVYSFAVVIVVFLAGLAAGAGLARRVLDRGREPGRALGWALSAGGLLVLASPRLFFGLTDGLRPLLAEGWLASGVRLLLLAGAVLLPACVALGFVLPLLMDMAGRQARPPGLVLGRLLAANTAGAVVGPVLVTFLLAPVLGLWRCIVLVGGLTSILGSLLPGSRRGRWIVWAALGGTLAALRPDSVPPVRVRADAGERLVSVREGALGTTAVLENERDRWISVDNAYVLGGAAAAGEERWQGHLPMLLHPAPARVAFLGMGTGIAAGALLDHPVARVVALEIVPEVAAAAREDFADINAHVVTDPRVTVLTEDGRNYLLAAPAGSFDVVVGDLLVPWRPGESPLYTREHFEVVRRALAPDGIFCQWLPLYQLSEEQLASLLRTFLDVFPRTTVWRGNFLPSEPTLALVGHRGRDPLDVAGIDARLSALAGALGSSNPLLADPAGFWLSLVGAPRTGDGWLKTAAPNTDDEPRVELLSPRGQGRPLVGAAMESVLDRIASSPLEGSPLASLDAAHRSWRNTGAALGKASLDRGPDGERRVLALLETLPAPLRSALGVAPLRR